MLALLSACDGDKEAASYSDNWQTEQYSITAEGVSLSCGDALFVTSDSTAILHREGSDLELEITLDSVPEGTAKFESTDPLIPFLYRLEATTDTAAGKSRPYLPYAIYINPLPAPRSALLLGTRLRNDLPVPPELSRYSWPVVRSNAQWLMAASETALAGGDERWTRQTLTTARQVFEFDSRMALNDQTGLFMGVPRYLINPVSKFPQWMEPIDLFQSMTLAENAAYHAALANIEKIASASNRPTEIGRTSAELRDAINSEFWNPATSQYSAVLYGNPCFPVRLASADNAAQAIAILGGVSSDAMMTSIATKAPAGPFGIGLLSPRWSPDTVPQSEFPPMLLRTMWMAAMGATDNETAYSASVAALIATRAKALFESMMDTHPHLELGVVKPISTLILRGFLGAKFAPEGLYLSPAVPPQLPSDKHISGLRYRNAVLDITITGTGQALATFTIDGHPTSPFIPAELEGEHKITITLAGSAANPGEITMVERQPALPAVPLTDWIGPLKAQIDTSDEDGYAVYIDGIMEQISVSKDYAAEKIERLTTVQFAGVSTGNLPGFTSSPRMLMPHGWETIISAADIATPGTKLIKDKHTAKKIVESNRWKNRNVKFQFTAPAKGRYIVDVRYSSGLGIVNPHRRTALRHLKVNNSEAGILVFPQYSPAWWKKKNGSDWQLPSTYSSQLDVVLQEGTNTLELAYFQPSPVYIDPLANTLLFDAIRLRRLD